jgi:Rrf2 family protein
MSKIVNLSEAASIAIHGMILVFKSDKPLNVIQIAERISSSKHHVSKIMQQLVKHGYLGSIRGPAGGFFLKMDPSEITFLDIYEIIEGKLVVTKCAMEKPVCTFEKCIFSNIIEKMTCDFSNYLKSQKLTDYS